MKMNPLFEFCIKEFCLFFILGLFSNIMRDLANINNDNPKWIVLDGDIDPMWIESLNTVMDDNKVIPCFPSYASHCSTEFSRISY